MRVLVLTAVATIIIKIGVSSGIVEGVRKMQVIDP
jgi:hypothetical protein